MAVELPLDRDALMALPGIGAYTAAAVAAIAGGQAVVAVDANVERVLSRLLAVETPLPASRPDICGAAAERLAARDRSGDFAQALMELGALVCTPRRPACLACPWRQSCQAAGRGDPEAFPRKTARAARATRFATAFLLERGDGAVLFRQRPMQGLLGGMIELPSTPWLDDAASIAMAEAEAAPAKEAWSPLPGAVRHVFTHIDLTVRLVRGRGGAATAGLWVTAGQIWRAGAADADHEAAAPWRSALVSYSRQMSWTCRGSRQGITAMRSNRTAQVASCGRRCRKAAAARAIRACCRGSSAASASVVRARRLTSTNTTRSPRRATRSISPTGVA